MDSIDLEIAQLPTSIVTKSHEEKVTFHRKRYNMAYHSNGYNERPVHEASDRSNNESNKPTYLMEHLATFTVTSETGIVYPADGMRRLLQLEKTNGIWSQKMQLCLDHPWVLIMDYETGTVMERFPASLIQEPTAFTSHDPMEIYNNILVFIVGSTGMGHNPYPEMHIFQCQSISALDLVEDLKQLRNGKSVTGVHKSSTHVPPPIPVVQNPVPPVIPSTSLHRERDRDLYRDSDLEVTGINDETSSTTSEKYERDVTVLNHCFDDIEKFIARLQHAAAASRELERRRRNRKSKKKDIGDGMLTMRTKPPPEKEFIDIFQKFKLSFNLLAKLKAHIHDPNAPELIHFLFTPLALIVDASHETFYDPHLPAKVVSPLLTREAINLLMNCVTSKETELWHSLGNAWLIPRDQWKGHVPPYHPVFMDGWSPDYTVMDEAETSIELKPNRDSHDDTHYNNDYFDYEQPVSDLNRLIFDKRGGEPVPHREEREPKINMMPPPPNREPHPRDMGARSDISVDSIERTGHDQEAWLADLQARGANIVQVTYPRTANNDKELTVVRGEYLEVLDDARKWWKARNWRGQVAHVPHTIVAPYHYGNSGANDNNDIFNNPLYTQNYNRNQGDAASETFSSTQSPSIQEQQASTDWVIKERLDKKKTPLTPVPPPMPTNMSTFKPDTSSTPSSNTSTLKSVKKSGPGNEANSHNILDELMKMQWPVLKTNIVKATPKVFINQNSKPEDVQKWMKAKGFSNSISKHFEEFNGEQMMSMNFSEDNIKTLENRFGPEGKRLVSQITLQKEICGFTVGRNSEFKHALKRAKERATADKTLNNDEKISKDI